MKFPLKSIVLAIFCFYLLSCQQKSIAPAAINEESIVAQITEPLIPETTVNILDYGAVGDSLTDCKPAFEKAIADIKEKGGGKVTVPAGKYLSNGPN